MSERLAVVGDIHGHLEIFDTVLHHYGDSIDGVVSVGDLISGGWYSKEVLERCQQVGARAIMANNEWGALAPLYHEDLTERYAMQLSWLMIGNQNKRRTLMHSYGVSDQLNGAEAIRKLAGALEETGHADYLLNLPLYIEEPDFIAVHAGLTDTPWDLQKIDLDMTSWRVRWLRNFSEIPPQISDHALACDANASVATDKVLVTGHAHKGCGPVDERVTADGKRVRLATHHWDREPLLVWENWTGDVRQFTAAT